MRLRPISIGHAARIIGRSVDTLRQWEHKGLVRPVRDTANRRIYSEDDIDLMRRLVAHHSKAAGTRG